MKDNFIQAKLRTIVWEIASWIALRNCSGQEWFSAVLQFLEQRTSNMTGIYFFEFKKKKKKTDWHAHSESVWTWHLRREPYH